MFTQLSNFKKAGESGVLTLIGVALVAGWLLYRWPHQATSAQSAI